MARTRVVVGRQEHGRLVFREQTGFGVKAELRGLVGGTYVRHDDEAIVGRNMNGVGFGAGLHVLHLFANGSVRP